MLLNQLLKYLFYHINKIFLTYFISKRKSPIFTSNFSDLTKYRNCKTVFQSLAIYKRNLAPLFNKIKARGGGGWPHLKKKKFLLVKNKKKK